MKNLLNLENVNFLSEVEQKSVLGGYMLPGCLSSGNYCHTQSKTKCCGECGNTDYHGSGVCV